MTQAAPQLETRLTSFAGLFGLTIGDKQITSIEIPLIQRDYAQGRKTAQVKRIREQFLKVVCGSLQPDAAPIELDFVYGNVDTAGKFIPLDGQQRLTLLFLLHCYLAWRTGRDARAERWASFSYATRPGARTFCAFLTGTCPDPNQRPSEWLCDHADYLPTWDYDPTIQSMLVVLDDLHDWFPPGFDFDAAWHRLVTADVPVIRFHVLPMAENGLSDAQYIKMNSRGKPLTTFENFKARFEELLQRWHPEQASEVALNFDNAWTDVLWRQDDPLIDDKFMHYLRFVCEIRAWTSGASFPAATDELTYLSELAERVFGHDGETARKNLDYLRHAFDIWHQQDIGAFFDSILTADRQYRASRLLISNAFAKEGVNLFLACCRHYGSREWDLAHSLLLHAALLRFNLPRQDIEIPDFANRLRIVRNLIEASNGDEIRSGERNNMPGLIADVTAVIADGDIASVSTLNTAQKQNELEKGAMLQNAPALKDILHELEDHDLLLGGLTAFAFEPTTFEVRARAFIALFDRSDDAGPMPLLDVSGALLAMGNYARESGRGNNYLLRDLGAPRNREPWKTLFRGKGRGRSPEALRHALMALLDAASQGFTPSDVMQEFLNSPSTRFDWRYYLVKYEVMRIGKSGRFCFSKDGYEACMLDKWQLNSSYMDPYLLAAATAADLPPDQIANAGWPAAFSGYESSHRWLALTSGLRLRSTATGWALRDIPARLLQSGQWQAMTDALQLRHAGIAVTTTGGSAEILLPQQDGIDLVDRIEVAAALLKALPPATALA
ncbi:MAG TPA: DUF262 domain-containing protein [Moraxellaceae bacterium]|nr:DUF262 domain-containing protein [Moraxellaceae bacterium]